VFNNLVNESSGGNGSIVPCGGESNHRMFRLRAAIGAALRST
jgi:hypothetical protein